MKIMSYEIPIYCWQLKRPGTGAARNFRVPLYLVTNLFWLWEAAGWAWKGPCLPQSPWEIWRLHSTRTWGPRVWMSPLKKAQYLVLIFQTASKMSAQQRCLSKNKGKAFFLSPSLSLGTMKRLHKKISRSLLALEVWCWDSLKYCARSLFLLSCHLSLFLFLCLLKITLFSLCLLFLFFFSLSLCLPLFFSRSHPPA